MENILSDYRKKKGGLSIICSECSDALFKPLELTFNINE